MGKDLLDDSNVNLPYLALIISSCAIATFGLVANSAAVIIGAMIIAPLMLPIRGLAFGALQGNVLLIRYAITAILTGTTIALLISCILGWLIGISNFGSEIQARSQPTLLDLGVAIAAGAISAYAKIEPRISGSLAGTAIAVALMPPVCTIGLGLSQGEWQLSQGASLLYMTNLLGITLSCMITFLVGGYARLQRARRVLILTSILTASLVIPLSVSFAFLVRQAKLETLLQRILLSRTVTFQRVELVRTAIDWVSVPPKARLFVRSTEPITPKQVRLVEEFVAQQMGQKFKLVLEINAIQEITSDSPTKASQ